MIQSGLTLCTEEKKTRLESSVCLLMSKKSKSLSRQLQDVAQGHISLPTRPSHARGTSLNESEESALNPSTPGTRREDLRRNDSDIFAVNSADNRTKNNKNVLLSAIVSDRGSNVKLARTILTPD